MNMIRPQRAIFFAKHYAAATLLSAAVMAAGFIVAAGGVRGVPESAAIYAWAAGGAAIIAMLIHTILYCNATTLYFRAEEVAYETGILEHHKKIVPIHTITDTKEYRSFFDKIIGAGTLKINTSGGNDYEIVAADFAHAEVAEFHDVVHGLIRKTPQSLPNSLAKK